MTDEEAKEKLIVKRIINRKTKRILKYPDEMTEAEYREGCQREISNILLEVCTVLFLDLSWGTRSEIISCGSAVSILTD